MAQDRSGQPRNIIIPTNSPAIWLYPADKTKVLHAEVALTFHGGGFMTSSTPNYNQRWHIDIDPTAPYYRYSPTYDNSIVTPYLDYDGFRAGDFQTSNGWTVRQEDLLDWQRSTLSEIGLLKNEVDDVNYSYGRMLLERKYEEPWFTVYPQEEALVASSVSLDVRPTPDSLFRLWLYFVPARHERKDLKKPQIKPFERSGFSVVELAYLTDRELPDHLAHLRSEVKGAKLLASPDYSRMAGLRRG